MKPPPPLNIPIHVRYIQNLDKKKDLAFHLTEHLRLNGVYWGYTALTIMGQPEALDRDEMVDYVMRCWDARAGEWLLEVVVERCIAGWIVDETM